MNSMEPAKSLRQDLPAETSAEAGEKAELRRRLLNLILHRESARAQRAVPRLAPPPLGPPPVGQQSLSQLVISYSG
ncbi:MAG: hypothetical protein SFX18_10565 [Pirellulales bacterium]|nr:hypothetical protein [Pirellulales bacterium]